MKYYFDLILKSYELAVQAEQGNGIEAVRKTAKEIQKDLLEGYMTSDEEIAQVLKDRAGTISS